MSESHHLDLPHFGRVSLLLEFLPESIKGLLEFPQVIKIRRHRRLVDRWLLEITRRLDLDPRPFLLASTIGGRLASIGRENKGAIVGLHFPL